MADVVWSVEGTSTGTRGGYGGCRRGGVRPGRDGFVCVCVCVRFTFTFTFIQLQLHFYFQLHFQLHFQHQLLVTRYISYSTCV